MVESTWLTAARTQRLIPILTAVPSRGTALLRDEARLRLWRACGGPIDEVMPLLDVLVGANLVMEERVGLRISRTGQTILTKRAKEGLLPLGLALLRAGYLHDQARHLIELGTSDVDGTLNCSIRAARRRCPQLVGILQWWPDVRTTPTLAIPAGIAAELNSVWALLPPPVIDEPAKDALRKNMGNRGELYSYHYETMNALDRSDIVWVARDDDNLGYDIEDRSTHPARRIEVKSSGQDTVRFFLSDNEWRKAHDGVQPYEIHFWGSVDVARAPADEYDLLRSRGYPLIIRDLPADLASGQFEAEPTKWRVTKASGPMSE